MYNFQKPTSLLNGGEFLHFVPTNSNILGQINYLSARYAQNIYTMLNYIDNVYGGVHSYMGKFQRERFFENLSSYLAGGRKVLKIVFRHFKGDGMEEVHQRSTVSENLVYANTCILIRLNTLVYQISVYRRTRKRTK